MKVQIVRGTTQIEGLNQASGNKAANSANSGSTSALLRSDAVVSTLKTAGGGEKPLSAKEADSFAKELAKQIREDEGAAEGAHNLSSGALLRESV
jgi:hypothetical protein